MKQGDRIELVAMPNDPCPITPGTRGTIDRISDVNLGDGPFKQLWVTWDDGRSLMPIVPPDVLRVLSPRTDEDEAYRVFMSMPQKEWLGLLVSLASGGVLEPAENRGFVRAEKDRRISGG